ncbi:MAG: IPT/TIG domain-containing protein [Bacteroides sp.]|nr:IPT/TIG domain-containing protein [Bacteroides sp.]
MEDVHTAVGAPVITSFEPVSGAPGSEIRITGSSLSSVDTVRIGGAVVKIKNRITNASLLVEVTAGAKSGKVQVRNPKGSGESSDNFEVTYVVPAIRSIVTAEPGEMVFGEIVTVKGSNLKAVSGIEMAGAEATLIYTLDSELQFKVPFLSGVSQAQVTFYYQEGESRQSILSDEVYTLVSSDLAPRVDEAPAQAMIGEQIILKGTNLDLAHAAVVGSYTVEFDSKTATEIKLTLPTTFHQDTTLDLILLFNETEQLVAIKDLRITVPAISDEVLFWPEVTLGAEASDLAPFFDPKTGNTYTPYEYQAVKNSIYIYPLSYGSGNTIQLNNPANNTTQAPRFSCDEVALPAEQIPNVVKYRVLKTTTSRENVYIEQVKTKTLGKISPEIIAEAGISNAGTSTPRYGSDQQFVTGDVLMFQKFDPTGVTVLEVGFIEILAVDIQPVLGESTVTFNCFFQK